MLLALDIRNAAVIAGFHSGNHWLSVIRLGTDRSVDELAFLLEAAARRVVLAGTSGAHTGSATDALHEGGCSFPEMDKVDSAWISSVVPTLTTRATSAVLSAFGLRAESVGPGTRTGLKIRTDAPSELGSDIVCSAVAARALVGGAALVVDSGSALVLSAVNSEGELLGAAIAPGMDTAARSLRASTAQLPEVRLDRPRRFIGRNTVQSVQSGIVNGYVGMVRHLVTGMLDEMGEPATVVATGDETDRDLLMAAGIDRYERNLALEGLAIIATRNSHT